LSDLQLPDFLKLPNYSILMRASSLIPRLSRLQYLAFGALCVIWGSTWMAIRVLVYDLPPFRAAAIRFVLADLMLIAIVLAKRLRWPDTVQQWRALIILGITFIGLPYGLLFWAERRITSSLTAVIYSASPLVVALLTPLMTGQRVPRRAVYGMVWALGGIAVLFYTGLSLSSYMLLGGIAAIASVLTSSWSTIYAKRHLKDVNPLVGSAIQFAVAAALLCGASLLREHGAESAWTSKAIWALGFLALFGSVVTFSLYYWLLRSLLPYQLSTLNLIVPLIAIMEGALILREPVPPVMLVASLVVLAAVGSILCAEDEQPQELGLRGS
jgi:drug/metabolite transporter (DMT)-like permease